MGTIDSCKSHGRIARSRSRKEWWKWESEEDRFRERNARKTCLGGNMYTFPFSPSLLSLLTRRSPVLHMNPIPEVSWWALS